MSIVGQHVHSNVIIVNNSGNISAACCINELCICGSLHQALLSTESNTIINITSQTISLHAAAIMAERDNITITSSVGTTIMCNNTGAVYCETCSNFTIERIIWDQCGIISRPSIPGITFNIASNISITNRTFQYFKACISIFMLFAEGTINVVNSKFMFNTISNGAVCVEGQFLSSLEVVTQSHDTNLIIRDSLFYNNGNTNQSISLLNGSLIYINFFQATRSVLITDTSFISNGIRGMLIHDAAKRSSITFNHVNISENKFGASVNMIGDASSLKITSSHFVHNNHGALHLMLNNKCNINLHNTTFANNKGTADILGTALYIVGTNSVINLSLCNFYNNIGGDSIVYIASTLLYDFLLIANNVSITSSKFMGNKIGSALKIAKCFLNFYSTTLFQDNSARSGAALYIEESSQISVDDGSTVQFINNTASLRGGAMYIDLTNCHDHGVVFTNFTSYDSISFINNSAKLSGNSIYFDIPNSCDVIRDYTNNDSAAYVPYKFKYTQPHSTVRSPISASPYEINICSSAKCSLMKNNTKLVIKNDIMLGQSVYFNTVVQDYFNGTTEATMFKAYCINCNLKYRLLENEVLAQNGSKNRIVIKSATADADVGNDTNIILNISSFLSPEYRQLTATLSLTLSSCNNGFLFTEQSQQCECYNKDDYLQCDEDTASIKLGYWFGLIHEQYTLSVCHNDYCNFFTHRKETRRGFYNLPEEVDDQCNSHRTGVACGQCSEGYTLAYNSPDCISVEKCSPGMTVLVIILTILYWIVIIAMLFGVAYFLNTQQISPGYLYGIVFFYSIVDILLVTNLHLTDAVFYIVTVLSSFTKLNPHFLGRLCFVENLDAIDQQFIHYCNVVFIAVILIIIYIIARCNNKNRALLYVNRFIVQVTCFVLLFSYTSLTSTSLVLLRAMKADNIDGLYTYLSPHLKYFANRHTAYASVALLCLLVVTMGLPLLLVMEPLLVKLQIEFITEKCTWFVRIKLLLHRLQDCYKDQHRWFAAYYLICRLVIMLIIYYANDDYDYMIYYLQTACVVITMTHIWIQPYENDFLNKLDTVILLVMLLIVNLSVFNFSTPATAAVSISLILFPLVLLLGIGVKQLLTYIYKLKKSQQNHVNNSDRQFRPE